MYLKYLQDDGCDELPLLVATGNTSSGHVGKGRQEEDCFGCECLHQEVCKLGFVGGVWGVVLTEGVEFYTDCTHAHIYGSNSRANSVLTSEVS